MSVGYIGVFTCCVEIHSTISGVESEGLMGAQPPPINGMA